RTGAGRTAAREAVMEAGDRRASQETPKRDTAAITERDTAAAMAAVTAAVPEPDGMQVRPRGRRIIRKLPEENGNGGRSWAWQSLSVWLRLRRFRRLWELAA